VCHSTATRLGNKFSITHVCVHKYSGNVYYIRHAYKSPTSTNSFTFSLTATSTHNVCLEVCGLYHLVVVIIWILRRWNLAFMCIIPICMYYNMYVTYIDFPNSYPVCLYILNFECARTRLWLFWPNDIQVKYFMILRYTYYIIYNVDLARFVLVYFNIFNSKCWI